MKSKKVKYKVRTHIENLHELKKEYESKGDTLNVHLISNMIEAKEQALKQIEESGA